MPSKKGSELKSCLKVKELNSVLIPGSLLLLRVKRLLHLSSIVIIVTVPRSVTKLFMPIRYTLPNLWGIQGLGFESFQVPTASSWWIIDWGGIEKSECRPVNVYCWPFGPHEWPKKENSDYFLNACFVVESVIIFMSFWVYESLSHVRMRWIPFPYLKTLITD